MSDNVRQVNGHLTAFRCALLVLVCFLVQGMVMPVSANAQAPVIDLSRVDSQENLALMMEGFSGEGGSQYDIGQVQAAGPWLPVAAQPSVLEAPRRFSSLWLRAELINGGPEPVQRWIEFSPWRLSSIDIWILDPDTGEILERQSTGLGVPVRDRQIESIRSVVPISLPAGSRAGIVVHIASDSRPFLMINSWEPHSFAQAESERYLVHSILLAIVLTLCVVLVLQFDIRYLLVGLWMIAMFILEAEKEGYVSYLLFSDVADYSANLRFSSAVFSTALFMVVSVWLLSLDRHVFWRWVTPVALGVAVVFSGLTFILDGVEARRLGIWMHIPTTFLWLMMVPVTLRQSHYGQKSLLLLLGIAWLNKVVFMLIYIFNIDYNAEFDVSHVVVDALVVLGLLWVYARQRANNEKVLECRIQERDRQEKARLEQTVAQRTEQLSQALQEARDADAAKTEFLGRVTHDLKSPLNSILGYTQFLKQRDDKARQMSDIIQGSARHMLTLVNRLIDYAHDVNIVESHPEPLHLPTFFQALEYEAHILAKHQDNVFQMRLAEDCGVTILADETVLREVLINLIDNACKYTKKGIISLGVSWGQASQGEKMMLKLEISDTGAGIALDVQDKLFEPFYRTTDSRGSSGSGLGLAIVKELVSKMAGTVRLDSTPGYGTKITVEIPVAISEEGNATII